MTLIKAGFVLVIFLSQCTGIASQTRGSKNMRMTVDSHPMLASVFSVVNNVKHLEIQERQLGRGNGAVKGAGVGMKSPVNLEKKKFDLFPHVAAGVQPMEGSKTIKRSEGSKTIIGDTTNAICRYCQKIQNVTCIQIYCFNEQFGATFESASIAGTPINNFNTRPTHSAFPAELRQDFPSVGNEPFIPVQPFKSAADMGQPMVPVQPMEPIADMGQPFVPVQPFKPAADMGQPFVPVQPMEPIADMGQPFVPVQPFKPAADMGQPMVPVQPFKPAADMGQPFVPVQPFKPAADMGQPMVPVQPFKPAADMGQPFVPVQPFKPAADIGQPMVPVQTMKPIADMGQFSPEFPANGVRQNNVPPTNGPDFIPVDTLPVFPVRPLKPEDNRGPALTALPVNERIPDNGPVDRVSSFPVQDFNPVGGMGPVFPAFPANGIIQDHVRLDNGQSVQLHHPNNAADMGQGIPAFPRDGLTPNTVPVDNVAMFPVHTADPLPFNPIVPTPIVNDANSFQQGNPDPNAISFDNEFRIPGSPTSSNIEIIPQQPIAGTGSTFPLDNASRPSGPLLPLGTSSGNVIPDSSPNNNQHSSLDMVHHEAMNPMETPQFTGDVNTMQGHGQIIAGMPIQSQPSNGHVNIPGARAFDAMNPLTSDIGSMPQLPDNIGRVAPNQAAVPPAQGFQELKPHLGGSRMQGQDFSDGQFFNPLTSNDDNVPHFQNNVEHVGSNPAIVNIPSAQVFQDLKPHSRLVGMQRAEITNNQIFDLMSSVGNDVANVQHNSQQVGPSQQGVQIAPAQGFQDLKPHSRLSEIHRPINTGGGMQSQRGASAAMLNSVATRHTGFVDELGQPIGTFSEPNGMIHEQPRGRQDIVSSLSVQGIVGSGNAMTQMLGPNAVAQTTTVAPTTVAIVTINPQRKAELNNFFNSVIAR